MVTVLAGLAEFERELILARTSDGRARAKARGVRFGRPAALTPHQRAEALQRLANGEVQAHLARSYGVSPATISRLPAGFFGGPLKNSTTERSAGRCDARGATASLNHPDLS